MPARHTIVAILLFWLSTVGWLIHRDIWPWLRRGEPPPYSIDLADEARKSGVKIRWVIRRPGRQDVIGRAYTWTRYKGERADTFDLNIEVKDLNFGMVPVAVKKITGYYRVTREGQLREINTVVVVTIALVGTITGTLTGEVHEQVLSPHCVVEFEHQPPTILDLAPVTLSAQSSVLNPLHPVNRVTGLRRGQHWRLPLMDPLSVSMAATIGSTPTVSYLDAEVLMETDTIRWNGQDWRCLVVQYTGNNRSAHTWVRESDGVVLRQDAMVEGDKLILERE
jgi:hypothetical protein